VLLFFNLITRIAMIESKTTTVATPTAIPVVAATLRLFAGTLGVEVGSRVVEVETFTVEIADTIPLTGPEDIVGLVTLMESGIDVDAVAGPTVAANANNLELMLQHPEPWPPQHQVLSAHRVTPTYSVSDCTFACIVSLFIILSPDSMITHPRRIVAHVFQAILAAPCWIRTASHHTPRLHSPIGAIECFVILTKTIRLAYVIRDSSTPCAFVI
jgi:hypothetical protein